MRKHIFISLFFISLFVSLTAQQVHILTAGKPISLRGLSVVSDQIIWVSGSAGTVGLSTDSGKNWKWMQVSHYHQSDFRDIEAFSDQEAVIMGITEPAVILRTADGGRNWTTVFEDSSKSVFLDAMDFYGNSGAVIGDPENGNIFFAETSDRGKSWKRKIPSGFALTDTGEAFFAASGSNILIIPESSNALAFSYVLVSGGKNSCLYISTHRIPLLIRQGEETSGANSIAVNPWNYNEAFITGGDFKQDTLIYGNSLQIRLNPFHQVVPSTPPHGYRSCVEYLNKKEVICCGTNGVDFSSDNGANWKLISNEGFHVCRRSKSGQRVYLAGANGKIGTLEWALTSSLH